MNRIKMSRALAETHRSRCHAQLCWLLAAEAGVSAATVSTPDGLEVASVSLEHTPHAGKLAAITSSLQALGAAVARELAAGALENITIEAALGRMFCVEIALSEQTLVLAVVTAKESLFARSFIATRDCARRIAADMAAS